MMNPDLLPHWVADDGYLVPFAPTLLRRGAAYTQVRAEIDANGGLLGAISEGHLYFGFNRGTQDGTPGVWYREWSPGARALFLTGDFNNWNRQSHPMQRDEWGIWHLFVPDDAKGENPLKHGDFVKVFVVDSVGAGTDRIPAYIRRVVQGTDDAFSAQIWLPPAPYRFLHVSPPPIEREGLRIYEAHVGMAQEGERVGSFDEFVETLLPRIAALGYNAVQLMAILEHPYYGSFGYHVSNFFAVSSRFGTPEDLKRLIDRAHEFGLRVLLDLPHSHAVKNTLEGLSHFDGTDYQYFHAGERGYHAAWDSRVFNYAVPEVRRFLLSNVRFWLDEFHFDGFRFDGVTSMLYEGHGLNRVFTSYDDYFGDDIDEDAIVYLKLANDLVKALRPDALTIAEEVSGMPGIARPTREAGIGFDYCFAMGVPDFWERVAKRDDSDWHMGELWYALLNRRANEKSISYVESHDQSIVGGKTFAFRLMDREMYAGMGVEQHNLTVERGVALHKMARLATFALAGGGYLNFIGNEWGHPEWVDFPRAENGFSYRHARRQWSLMENPALRFHGLNVFDGAMQHLDSRFYLLNDPLIEQLLLHEDDKLLVFRRGPLVFAFNFHAENSYSGLRIPVPDRDDYQTILDTDESRFAGHGRVEPNGDYPLQTIATHGRKQSVQIYLPSRTAQVLAPRSLLSLTASLAEATVSRANATAAS